MLMTGEQYIESLRKLNTRVYMFGEKVENWVDHPIIRPSINCVKVTYDLAQDPEYKDLMTAKSSLTGETINRFSHLHQSTEDLKNKVKMQRLRRTKTAHASEMRRYGRFNSCSHQHMKLIRSMAQTITKTSRTS